MKLFILIMYIKSRRGQNLFTDIDGDLDTIMGLPIKK